MTLKCHLIDGSERTHQYELEDDFDKAAETMRKLLNGIRAILQTGKVLPMTTPEILYAPGQVKYIEVDLVTTAEELDQSMKQQFKTTLGFIKE